VDARGDGRIDAKERRLRPASFLVPSGNRATVEDELGCYIIGSSLNGWIVIPRTFSPVLRTRFPGLLFVSASAGAGTRRPRQKVSSS
jgi:hypothetical protein